MMHHKHYLIAEDMPDEFTILNVGIAEVIVVVIVILAVFAYKKISRLLRDRGISLREMYGGIRGEATGKH